MLLIALGAGANVAIGMGQQEQTAVLAASRDLPAGHVLSEEDVRIVHWDGAAGGLQLVDARSGQAIGSRLAVPVTEGAPITEGMLGSAAAYPPEGRAIVAAAVGPGVLPGAAEQGSPVAVIITPAAAGAAGTQTAPPASAEAQGEEGRSVPARIHRVRQADPATGTSTVVELLVDAADAEAVARAAGQERLRLAVVSQAEGGL
ncbi:SAF domain-containing protein [Streptomonospora sp. PA3]|uniref:SAF domain-containing protein n=1 Tax=Streptomonospora sp. PA3 TaxID=2607326 RepID=UPI001642E206